MTTFKDELEKILKDYQGMDFCGDTACLNYQACIESLTSIINLVDKELPDLKEEYDQRDRGYNEAIKDMRAKLKGVNNG